MKKKLLFGGVALLLAAAAVTGFAAYEKSNVSDLLNANVEALARNETVQNAYTVWVICGKCNMEIEGCHYCVEPDCGSCTPEEHSC